MADYSRSDRTIIRDALISAFNTRKANGAGRITPFSVSPRYLLESESTTKNTYCVIITDESREANTLGQDDYSITVKIVVYAYDTKDPRAVLDGMIEDAIETVRGEAEGLKATAWKLALADITTDEGTTEAGPWAQAVLRWQAYHRRAVV